MTPNQVAYSRIEEKEPTYTCQRCDREELEAEDLCEHMEHDWCADCCDDNEKDYHFSMMKDDMD